MDDIINKYFSEELYIDIVTIKFLFFCFVLFNITYIIYKILYFNYYFINYYIHVCVYIIYIIIHYIYIYIYVYTYIYIYMYIHVYMYVCVYTYTTYIHVTHMRVRAYTHSTVKYKLFTILLPMTI